MKNASFRAQLVARRTYSRPKNDIFNSFETWEETISRVVSHQSWLWERAKGSKLSIDEHNELNELRQLLLDRKVMVAGRTLWLGGTEVTKRREATMFNCSYLNIRTIQDVVDAYWLLMQGCGVGFTPITGILSGFATPIEVEVIRSNNSTQKGREHNIETHQNGEWTVSVGDSAEAWVKAIGKIIANKKPTRKLTLDFSQIRKAGIRLRGYGWISSGDETIAVAFPKIVQILSTASGRLLNKIEILDVLNWLGTTLSSRRSAEIALLPFGDKEIDNFMVAKGAGFWNDNPQRSQSNNSIVFDRRPTKSELKGIFATIIENGVGEPGFINGAAALTRAPYFSGVNPCAEILLGDKSFCNLVEVNLPAFNGQWAQLLRAIHIIARANYRQTCVDLRDGILQESWHELNNYLRLTGVGLTGIIAWEHWGNKDAFVQLRAVAVGSVSQMANELGLPPSQNVTTVKPSGTLSKIMDTTEGIHKPLGQYIFNNIVFSKNDELIPLLREANYYIVDHPIDSSSVLVRVPIAYDDLGFKSVNGIPINADTAIQQLERYKFMMDHYVDHNCSITISYDPKEVPLIVDWLHKNWDSYVGVSWLFRNDPTKFAYLPQQVVAAEEFNAYASTLKEVNIQTEHGSQTLDVLEDACATGMCPIR